LTSSQGITVALDYS